MIKNKVFYFELLKQEMNLCSSEPILTNQTERQVPTDESQPQMMI